jgi:hypothetical protein
MVPGQGDFPWEDSHFSLLSGLILSGAEGSGTPQSRRQ